MVGDTVSSGGTVYEVIFDGRQSLTRYQANSALHDVIHLNNAPPRKKLDRRICWAQERTYRAARAEVADWDARARPGVNR